MLGIFGKKDELLNSHTIIPDPKEGERIVWE